MAPDSTDGHSDFACCGVDLIHQIAQLLELGRFARHEVVLFGRIGIEIEQELLGRLGQTLQLPAVGQDNAVIA
ncbi:MAG: hypothetical protein WDN04_07470 [Rhodospirillales bacterium]